MAAAGNGISIQVAKHIKPANNFTAEIFRIMASFLVRISMELHVCGLFSAYLFHVVPEIRADPWGFWGLVLFPKTHSAQLFTAKLQLMNALF
jgi:hypothetical protein